MHHNIRDPLSQSGSRVAGADASCSQEAKDTRHVLHLTALIIMIIIIIIVIILIIIVIIIIIIIVKKKKNQ